MGDVHGNEGEDDVRGEGGEVGDVHGNEGEDDVRGDGGEGVHDVQMVEGVYLRRPCTEMIDYCVAIVAE